MLVIKEEKLSEKFCQRSHAIYISSSDFLCDLNSFQKKIRLSGERLALCFEDSYYFTVAFFAVLSLGKQIVILPNNKRTTQLGFKSEYDGILDDESFLNFGKDSLNKEIQISSDAIINFYTSGSMGTSKKVTKRFENLFKEISVLEETFGKQIKDSVVLSTVTHQHIYGFLFKILWPTLNQRCWYARSVEYSEQVLEISKQLNSFILVSTPAFLKRSFQPRIVFTNCRAVFSSGGPLTFETVQIIKDCFDLIPTEIYGSTESGGVGFRQSERDNQEWTPFAGIKVAVDSEGQLLLNGPYFDQPKLLMADLAVLQPLGFRLLGRCDDVVKIEEKRISLAEINKKILEIPWVKDSVVIALDLESRQQTACLAVIENVKNPAVVIREIRSHLANYFELSVIPKKFRFLDKLPYNSQSKLNRNELLGYFNVR